MYQIVYFKNSRSLSSNLKAEYVVRSYPTLNIGVYNDEIYSFNPKNMKRIISLEDISLIPTGYLIVKVNDWDDAYNYFIDKRVEILIADEEDKRIVVEIPHDVTIDKYQSDTIVLPFVSTCIVDQLFDLIPSLRFPPLLDTGPTGGPGKEPKPVKNPNYLNIPYENYLNWALQDVHSAEAWDLIAQYSQSSSPVTVTLFDTRVDTEHPDLFGKIDSTSVNYFAVYQNNTSDWVNTPALFLESCAQSGGLSNLTAQGLINLRNGLHGTGVAGILAASNANNILTTSSSKDYLKLRVAVITDVFTDGMTCGQLVDTVNNGPSNYSSILVWDMAFSKESYLFQPNTVAYVFPYKLPYNPTWMNLLETFTSTLPQNREGRGSVLFVSHGNSGDADESMSISIDDYSNTYLVSASDIFNNRAGFSNYGSVNFIAAPGKSVLTTSTRGTVADDNLPISQTLGLNNINQNPQWVQNSFNLMKLADGTSISAAFVASIWATMVYVRPTLTEAQGIDILKETSRKVGDYEYNEEGRSDELGYGIIDHEAAIQGVLDLLPTGFGNNWVSSETIEVNISNAPEEITDDSGEFVSVEYIVDVLDPNVVPLIRKIYTEIWICDNYWFEYNTCELVATDEYIVSAQTNTDDSINLSTLITNTCDIPTGEKRLFVKTQAFGYGGTPLSYGISEDQVGVSVIAGTGALYLNSTSSVFCKLSGLTLEYLGLVGLGNGISTTSPAGVAWKFRVSTPATWDLIQEVFPISIQSVRIKISIWDETNQVWQYGSYAQNTIFNGQTLGENYALISDPTNLGSPGLWLEATRERLFVFVNQNNLMGQIITGLPVQMKAEIVSVRLKNPGQIPTFFTVGGLNIYSHPGIRALFTIDSWPGLTSPSGTNFG